MKQTEGNPATKARIRRMQRQSRRKQMLKAAETATVVITNPTHYAVALRYEANMAAPVVVAKGLDLLAAKIKEIAWKHDIPDHGEPAAGAGALQERRGRQIPFPPRCITPWPKFWSWSTRPRPK